MAASKRVKAVTENPAPDQEGIAESLREVYNAAYRLKLPLFRFEIGYESWGEEITSTQTLPGTFSLCSSGVFSLNEAAVQRVMAVLRELASDPACWGVGEKWVNTLRAVSEEIITEGQQHDDKDE